MPIISSPERSVISIEVSTVKWPTTPSGRAAATDFGPYLDGSPAGLNHAELCFDQRISALQGKIMPGRRRWREEASNLQNGQAMFKMAFTKLWIQTRNVGWKCPCSRTAGCANPDGAGSRIQRSPGLTFVNTFGTDVWGFLPNTSGWVVYIWHYKGSPVIGVELLSSVGEVSSTLLVWIYPPQFEQSDSLLVPSLARQVGFYGVSEYNWSIWHFLQPDDIQFPLEATLTITMCARTNPMARTSFNRVEDFYLLQ